MKTVIATIALAFIVSMSFCSSASAQYGMTQAQMMQHFYAQNQQLTNKMMNIYKQQQQRHQERMKQLIKQYRKETGDIKSTDQQIIQRMTIESKRRYPQQWAQIHQRQMQMNRDNFNKRQAAIRKTNDYINNLNRSSNNYRNQVQDRLNQQYTDYIRGESNYRNPNTGRVVKLPHSTPNTYYHNYNSGANYYQSQNGQYYQYQNGYRTQLNPYHR